MIENGKGSLNSADSQHGGPIVPPANGRLLHKLRHFSGPTIRRPGKDIASSICSSMGSSAGASVIPCPSAQDSPRSMASFRLRPRCSAVAADLSASVMMVRMCTVNEQLTQSLLLLSISAIDAVDTGTLNPHRQGLCYGRTSY